MLQRAKFLQPAGLSPPREIPGNARRTDCREFSRISGSDSFENADDLQWRSNGRRSVFILIDRDQIKETAAREGATIRRYQVLIWKVCLSVFFLPDFPCWTQMTPASPATSCRRCCPATWSPCSRRPRTRTDCRWRRRGRTCCSLPAEEGISAHECWQSRPMSDGK